MTYSIYLATASEATLYMITDCGSLGLDSWTITNPNSSFFCSGQFDYEHTILYSAKFEVSTQVSTIYIPDLQQLSGNSN